MLDIIQQFDKEIIFAVQKMRTPLFDEIMIGISDKNNWVGVFIAVVLFSLIKYRLKGLKFIFFLVLLFGIVDFTSATIIKPFFGRLRPCHTLDIKMLLGCGGQYGFWSNHAANMFAIFHFIVLILRRRTLAYLLYLIPLLTAFSRVYLVKHYMTDVIFGALYGIFWASLIYKFYSFGSKKK